MENLWEKKQGKVLWTTTEINHPEQLPPSISLIPTCSAEMQLNLQYVSNADCGLSYLGNAGWSSKYSKSSCCSPCLPCSILTIHAHSSAWPAVSSTYPCQGSGRLGPTWPCPPHINQQSYLQHSKSGSVCLKQI